MGGAGVTLLFENSRTKSELKWAVPSGAVKWYWPIEVTKVKGRGEVEMKMKILVFVYWFVCWLVG